MAEFELQIVDVGTIPDDGTGDELRTAFILCNTNFSERMAGLVSQGGTVADGVEPDEHDQRDRQQDRQRLDQTSKQKHDHRPSALPLRSVGESLGRAA